jgi:hypothetical protein
MPPLEKVAPKCFIFGKGFALLFPKVEKILKLLYINGNNIQ